MLGNMCEEMFYQMNLALDGEISEFEQKQLDDHLSTCPHCAALWEELCQMQLAVLGLEEEPSQGFASRVLEQIQRETETPKVVPFRKKLMQYGGIAACAALCIGLYQSGIFNMSSDSSSMSMSTTMTTTTTAAMSTSTAMPESAVEYVIEDRAVAEIDESYESAVELESDAEIQSFSVTTTTTATADTAAGLTLPEQVAVLLGVEETAWVMILPDELPDPFLEGMGDLVVMEHFSYVIVELEHWDDVRVELNFGVSIETPEEGVPCVVIIMPE